MKVKPVLWRYEGHQDGTFSIKLYVYQHRKKRYLTSGLSIRPEHWDDKNGQVKRSFRLAAQYNGELRRMCLEIEDKLLAGKRLDELDQAPQSGSLIEFAGVYIDEVRRGLHDIKLSTCKNYEYARQKLLAYSKFKGLSDLTFDQIDVTFYHEFCNYLQEHHRCNRPGISKHVKNIKKFMNEAAARKLHDSTGHKDPGFRVYKNHSSNKIWLNEKEVAQLEALDLSTQPALERERDRWLLSYYFLMRYSDSVAIRESMVFEKDGKRYLRYSSVKTEVEVALPVKPKAWEILQKYSFKLGSDTNQEANRKLKLIGAMAGLVEETQEGGRRGPKCQFLATHTARRSAATQMYLQNVSLQVIANLGGWKRLETLKLYLRASGLEVALMAHDLDFFK